ncbi:MAG: hypothetical protein DHS80DRAFT_21046 [Piptocephalis tieghemiana]|nr:MAG: hypothetical protein DHS80DRAFT_21046 [Piptocephalis tieghemiana]
MDYPDGRYDASSPTLDDQLGGLLLPILGHALFLLIPLTVFILMRRRPSLRHRCPHITVIISLGNGLIGSWACLRLAINPTVVHAPCLVETWLLGLGIPLWFLGMVGRWTYTIRISKSHQHHLGLLDASSIQGKSGLESTITIQHIPHPVYEKKKENWIALRGGSTLISRIKGSLDHRISLKIYCVFAIHLFILIYLTLDEGVEASSQWDPECLGRWGTLGWMIAGLVYLLIPFPILTYQISRVNEAHGIRLEYFLTLGISLISLLLCILVAVLPSLPREGKHLWYSIIVEIYLLASFTTTVIHPLWRSGRPIPLAPEMTRGSFLKFLEDPVGLGEFKEFCTKDFSIENAVFYERIRAVILGYSEIQEDRGRRRLQRIYDFHLDPLSPLTVNLTSGCMEDLRGSFREGRLKDIPPLEYLQRALDEVVTLMYQSTCPRFMQHRTRCVPHASAA